MRQTNYFGDELRQLREACGFTVGKLAELAGISESYVSNMETGKVPPPSEDVILRLEKAVNSKEFILFYMAIKDGFDRVPKEWVEHFVSFTLKLKDDADHDK